MNNGLGMRELIVIIFTIGLPLAIRLIVSRRR